MYKDGNTTPELVKDYVGNFIYNDIESLGQILTNEGVLVPTEGDGFQYQYFLKDHLGNTRIMFTKKGDVLAKWIIRIGGDSVLCKKLYDGYNIQPSDVPANNTNVIPPIFPQLYIPIPDPFLL